MVKCEMAVDTFLGFDTATESFGLRVSLAVSFDVPFSRFLQRLLSISVIFASPFVRCVENYGRNEQWRLFFGFIMVWIKKLMRVIWFDRKVLSLRLMDIDFAVTLKI